MAVRVDQLVPYGYTDTAIATFHAFGDRLIREYALELGLPPDVRVLSRAEVVIFLREHLFEFDLDAYRPLGDPTRFLTALATLFSRCKDEDITPATYAGARRRGVGGRGAALGRGGRPTAADGRCGRGRWPEDGTPAGGAGPRLRAATRNSSRRTASSTSATRSPSRCGWSVSSPAARDGDRRRGSATCWWTSSRTRTGPRRSWSALLAEPHRNVTVVGDDDQAIYAFRGAAIDNILEFEARYPGARTVVLRRNYRSLAPILDAAYRLVRFNDPDRLEVRTGLTKRLRAGAPRPGAAAGPARGVRDRFGGGGLDRRRHRPTIAAGAAPRDHAVLVRANGHADAVLRALNMAGVPWRFSGSSGLYARPEVRLLMAFLRTIADPDSSVDLYALAASDVYGLGGEDLTAIVNSARRRNRSVLAVMDELERQPGVLRSAPATREATVARLRRRRDARTPRWPTSVRPARCCMPSCATAGCWRGSPRRDRPPPRRASATSRGSSTSSAPSRPCWPTTAPYSSPSTSRRSSTPATIRRRRTSTPTRTRSRS